MAPGIVVASASPSTKQKEKRQMDRRLDFMGVGLSS
jgi:hypothetical protein